MQTLFPKLRLPCINSLPERTYCAEHGRSLMRTLTERIGAWSGVLLFLIDWKGISGTSIELITDFEPPLVVSLEIHEGLPATSHLITGVHVGAFTQPSVCGEGAFCGRHSCASRLSEDASSIYSGIFRHISSHLGCVT